MKNVCLLLHGIWNVVDMLNCIFSYDVFILVLNRILMLTIVAYMY